LLVAADFLPAAAAHGSQIRWLLLKIMISGGKSVYLSKWPQKGIMAWMVDFGGKWSLCVEKLIYHHCGLGFLATLITLDTFRCLWGPFLGPIPGL
jgi:hypothetical protein